MILRSMQAADLDAIMEIENLCFITPWSRASMEAEVENRGARYTVCEIDGKIVGYVGMWLVFDEGHITNIAVHPDHRRQGIARALMDEMIALAHEYEMNAMYLEVRVGNTPAKELYKKLGFKPYLVRKKYYEDTGEDAICMVKVFEEPRPA